MAPNPRPETERCNRHNSGGETRDISLNPKPQNLNPSGKFRSPCGGLSPPAGDMAKGAAEAEAKSKRGQGLGF